MNKLILTNVGTSALENRIRFNAKKWQGKRKELSRLSRVISSQLDAKKYGRIINSACREIGQARPEETSAEIKSLNGIGTSLQDLVVLISSDTAECLLNAHILRKTILEIFECKRVEVKVARGVQVDDPVRFEKTGILSYLKIISRYKQKYEGRYEIILNPTGGFKCLWPYATLAAINYGIEMKYIYQSSDRILTLPVMPLSSFIKSFPGSSLGGR